MNKFYYWLTLVLSVLILNSYKGQPATLIDTNTDIADFSKFSSSAQKKYEENQAQKLTDWTDESKNCPLTTSYIERLLRRLYVFSELSPFLESERTNQQRSFTLRMACGAAGERRFIQQEFGVLNFGTEILPLMKSEDQIAALLSLELARFMLGFDFKALDVKTPFFRFGRSQRVLVMKRNMIYDIDSLAARILINAGYDAFALLEVIDLSESYYADREAPISIGLGKSEKRRAKLQDLMIAQRIGPAKQVDGAVPRVKIELAESSKVAKDFSE